MRNVIELYYKGMSANALAIAVITEYFDGKEPSFPIDPFKMIRDFGIVYQFMDFKELEGIYVLPDNEDDIPVIGINFNRPITRQRYTVAHELCHHIKDRGSSICPIKGRKNNIESYAETFASELLMPTKYLLAEAKKYAVNGKLNRCDILKIAEHFGTSFESTVFAVAYKINMLEGDTTAKVIKKKIKNLNQNKRK